MLFEIRNGRAQCKGVNRETQDCGDIEALQHSRSQPKSVTFINQRTPAVPHVTNLARKHRKCAWKLRGKSVPIPARQLQSCMNPPCSGLQGPTSECPVEARELCRIAGKAGVSQEFNQRDRASKSRS
jgi:hypothetical protein